MTEAQMLYLVIGLLLLGFGYVLGKTSQPDRIAERRGLRRGRRERRQKKRAEHRTKLTERKAKAHVR